ncbi:MAG: ChuX/HutX family heme-like substrate-binding protein [Betaproteobacteria bacterium]
MSEPAGSTSDPAEILAGWKTARAQSLNNRAAAAQLGVSEAQLIASACGTFVTRLRPDFAALLSELPALEEIKAIVRNPLAVLERTGVVESVTHTLADLIRVAADRFHADCWVDLWCKVFALEEHSRRGVKRSLQFFTDDGISAAKFFLRPGSDLAHFLTLTQRYAHLDQCAAESVEAPRAHHYSPVDRLTEAPDGALFAFLNAASAANDPLTFIVRNPVAALSATKSIDRVKRSGAGAWVNVLDEGMDLHLHEAHARYVRLVPDSEGDSGYFHWLSEQRDVILSVHTATSWETLNEAIDAAV